MKRILLALGILGIVGGAMGQSSGSSSVTFSVGEYRAIQFLPGSLDLAITDGGFSTSYDSPTRDFQTRANTTWSVSADTSALSAPSGWTFTYSGLTPSGGMQNWTTYSGAKLTLSGPGTGLAPGSFGGTLTLNIGP